MPELRKLSDTSADAGKNAFKYIRLFRTAVADEQIQAFELAERFKIPASTKGGKAREVQDFGIIDGPDFEAWHTEALTKSQTSTRTNAPTFAEVQGGAVDVAALVAATQAKLKSARERSARSNAKKRSES